jgi:fumarate hydratase class II
VFVDKLLDGLEVNRGRCEALIGQSLMLVTSLAPEIGYDNAAKLAKEAFASGKTIRQIAIEKGLLTADRLDQLLDPTSMTRPGGSGSSGG